MLFRTIVLIAMLASGAGAAVAQQPRAANNPSVTKKPVIDAQNLRPPDYPIYAMRNGLGGETVLKLCVDACGKVTSAEVSKSSGHQILDEAALTWMKQTARFQPAEASGQRVPVCNYAFTYVWDPPEPRPTGPDEKIEEIANYIDVEDLEPGSTPFIRSQPAPPSYPASARARKVEGPVKLELCISPNGAVAGADVRDIQTDMDLLIATMNWFAASVYEPGKKDGKPIGACGFKVEYTWKLQR